MPNKERNEGRGKIMKILFDDEVVYSIRDVEIIELCGMPIAYWEALVKIQREHPEIGFQFYLSQDGRLDWVLYYLTDAKRDGKKIIVLGKQRSE